MKVALALILGLALAAFPAPSARAGSVVVIDGLLDSRVGEQANERVIVRTDVMKYTIPLSALNSQQQAVVRGARPEQRVSVTVAVEKIERMAYIEGTLSR